MQMIGGTDFSRSRRGPFLSPIEIVMLAAIVGALLFLLFPGRDFENPRHLSKADDLSMAYLRMLLRAHPDDADARLLLVQQQMALGRFDEAGETLEPLRGRNDAVGEKAEVVALKLDRTQLYALAPDDPNRAPMQAAVKREALKLIPRTSRADDLAELADFILALGEPAEAARAYRRLATVDAANTVGWLEKAGRWFIASGDAVEAARVYSQGALAANDPRQGARMGRQALVALLAANQGKAGLAIAKPIVERYPRDLGLLEQAVRMAVASGDLSTARRWGEQRVIAAGSSDQALREQVDILIKAGDPVGAYKVAKGLLSRNPGDATLRKQVALLARWSSDPEESLVQWTWLARRGNEDARKTALDLAIALSDSNTEVEMLMMRVKKAKRIGAPRLNDLEKYRKGPPSLPRVVPIGDRGARRRPLTWPAHRLAAGTTPEKATAPAAAVAPGGDGKSASKADKKPEGEAGTPVASTTTGAAKPAKKPAPGGDFELSELAALADALEAKGLPERAIKVMDDFRFNFADKPDYWVRIARLYESSGELEQALACYEQLNRLKAMTIEDAIKQSKLLWRLLRPEAALTRLVGLRGQARETDTDYWRLLGQLAWRVENDLLAAEAFGILWKKEKTADVAEPLFRTLDELGRKQEAIGVAEEAYSVLGASGFLVSAVDIAVREGMHDRAKALFARANGKEKQFDLESHFWFQRAQLAFGEERFGEAEQDLQHVLAIDPGSEEAHVEWLTVAVHAQDKGMAERALKHWGKAAEADADSWSLLSDAYTLINDETTALRFKRLAREERIRQRLATGRPMTPEEHVEEAVERHDKRAVEVGLRLYGTTLSLPMRVAALRELGRDEDAWDLINDAGLASGGRRTAFSENALALGGDIRDLRENYLDGAWAFGSIRTLGALEERNYGARLELRFGDFFVGAEGSYSQLRSPGRQQLTDAAGATEQHAFFLARWRQRIGETSLRAGFEILPDTQLPHVELKQKISLLKGRFEASLAGIYGELPAYSSVLRAVAVRDAVEADAVVAVAGPFEVGVQGTMGRFVTRYGNALTTESAGKLELAFRLPVKSSYIRPRLDAFANIVPPLEGTIPPEIDALVNKDSEFFNVNDVLGLQYSTVGLGLGFGSTLADVNEARGPHVSLRYQLDLWGGYVWPAGQDPQAAYAVDGALGLVFARHQELSVHGFYYSDFRNVVGEMWWGASVNYTLRWFR